MNVKEKLQELMQNASADEKVELQKALDALNASDKTVGSDDAFMKAAELIADKVASAIGSHPNKIETKANLNDEGKRLFFTFGEDAAELDVTEIVNKKNAESKQVRRAKYAKALKEGDFGYIQEVAGRVALYFQAVVEKNFTVIRALSEGVDADGGYLVPEEFRAEVMREVANQSVMRQIATVIPMTTNLLKIPKETARPTLYWEGEDEVIATTTAEFGEVQLAPKKLIARLPITRELLADSAIAMVQYLTRVFSERMSEQEDKAFFTGNGTTQPKGVNTYTLGSVAAGSSKGDALIQLQHRLKAAYRSRGVFVANSTTIMNARKLKDSQNQYLFQTSLRDGAPEQLLGRPIFEQNDLPNGTYLFGDFSAYLIGDREQMTVETTTEGGTAWTRDRLEMKVRERVDGRLGLTNLIKKGTGF